MAEARKVYDEVIDSFARGTTSSEQRRMPSSHMSQITSSPFKHGGDTTEKNLALSVERVTRSAIFVAAARVKASKAHVIPRKWIARPACLHRRNLNSLRKY